MSMSTLRKLNRNRLDFILRCLASIYDIYVDKSRNEI